MTCSGHVPDLPTITAPPPDHQDDIRQLGFGKIIWAVTYWRWSLLVTQPSSSSFTAQQSLSKGGGIVTMKEMEEEWINGRMDNKSPTSRRVLLTGMFANSWNEYGTFVRAFITIGHPSNLASSLIYSGHLQMYRRQCSPPLSLLTRAH